MSTREVDKILKEYPTLIPVLKTAGLIHRSQIISIKVHREVKKDKLYFQGEYEYKSNSGGFTVVCQGATIKIKCDFGKDDVIVRPTFEIELQ